MMSPRIALALAGCLVLSLALVPALVAEEPLLAPEVSASSSACELLTRASGEPSEPVPGGENLLGLTEFSAAAGANALACSGPDCADLEFTFCPKPGSLSSPCHIGTTCNLRCFCSNSRFWICP